MTDPVWFPRLAAMPGVTYKPPAGIDAADLPGYGSHPQIHRYADLPPSLWWGETTEAPARAHASRPLRSRSLDGLLIRLAEVLELPGEPTDYHYPMQDAILALARRGPREPRAWADFERLCWLDIELIQAQSEAFRLGDDRPGYVSLPAFGKLLNLYAQEGLLADGMRVLDIANRFGAGSGRAAEQLPERYTTALAEDTGSA